MKFILFLIFLFVFTVNVRASSDDGNVTDSNSGDSNDSSDTANNTTSQDSSNTSSTSNNSSDANNSTDSNTNSNNNSSTRNTNIPVNNPVRKINRNTNTNYNNSSTYNNYNSPRQDYEAIDPETGLTFGTLRILSRLSPCKRQLLTNYRRLLRSPTIRLQFYRDLYQRHQSERVRTGCGDGDGTVKLGYRERAVLLGDPGFRARVEKMMRQRQPVGVALNGPVRYPNDIVMDNTQPTQNVLTISKQY